MSRSRVNGRCATRARVVWTLAAVLGLAAVPNAFAHQDPPNCAGIDSSMSLTVFRNNGVPVGGGTVTECETVRLRSSLEWQSECLIAGGAFRLGTVRAGNVFNSLSTVADPVPCLGAATVNADGCSIGQPTEVDTLTDVVYTVQPADIVNGTITFRASWENGTLHQSASNVPGQSDQRQIVIPVQLCNDNQFCNGVETCDPTATNGTQLGLCQPGVTPCVDNLFCSNVVCNEATDSCDTTDISTSQCPDNLFCGTVACNEATDACDTTDISTSQCPDNQFCADVVCSEASDSCVTTDTSTSQCPDNLFCGTVACSEASDSCVTTDISTSQCPDNLFCGTVACSEASDSCVTTDISTSQCPDNDFCANIVCSEASDSCVTTDTSTTQCPDNLFCGTVACSEASDSCVTTDISTSQCPDNDFCANIVCSEASDSCVTTDISTTQCPDNQFCANIVCSEATDSCTTTDISSSQCPDNLFCANVTCSEATDSCTTTDTSTSQCPDNLFCSDITCSEATDSCVTTDVSSKCDTDPNIPDQCELCVEASDQCVVDLTQDPICQPQELICRTPGFWGTHADEDESKNCSQDITQAVITEGGGTLNICGERIVNTAVNDAASAVEAICASPRGNSKLQLARQLTSMALNCIVSGGTAGCGGTEIPTNLTTLFTTCNAVCAGTSTAKSVGSCIGEIDCFNNGGDFAGGTCSPGGENNCHNRALPLEDLDLPNNDASAGSCFGKQGAAGSSDECHAARDNNCAVLNTTSGADEDNCGADSAP